MGWMKEMLCLDRTIYTERQKERIQTDNEGGEERGKIHPSLSVKQQTIIRENTEHSSYTVRTLESRSLLKTKRREKKNRTRGNEWNPTVISSRHLGLSNPEKLIGEVDVFSLSTNSPYPRQAEIQPLSNAEYAYIDRLWKLSSKRK